MHAAGLRRVGVQRRPAGVRKALSGRACSQTCKGVVEHAFGIGMRPGVAMTSVRHRRLATWTTRTSRAVEWETRMAVDTSEVLKILAVQGMGTWHYHDPSGRGVPAPLATC
jgi:hypothetical protein